MIIIIGPMDLVGDVKKLKGLMGLNPGNAPRTQVWGRLERIASALIPGDKRPYTNNIKLYINDGGIDHDTLSKHYKKVFKEDVLPAIKRIKPDLKNFWLYLNFNVDILTKVTLDDGNKS